ncbi:MAG: DUF4434 domain-containing protein [Clostridia bacterium]|nr:DUF4434 domain-containing protein [Clostridia bacterium]
MKSIYPISGTFIDEITYDIPSSNWSREEWAKDLDNMMEVGIDTAIFIRGGFYNKTIFPSKHFPHIKDETDDFAGFILEEAQKRGINIFFGLYISTLTWNDGDAQTEIERNRLFIDEVLERYSHFTSFKGWYIPHEVGNDVFNISDVFNGLGKLCKEKSPEKPILISPFFYTTVMVNEGALSPEQTFEEWDKILAKSGGYIDYCAFQDGSAPFDKMDEYFAQAKRVCDKYGIELWSNVEGLDRDIPKVFAPVSFDVLKAKINKVKPYVKKYITFEFSHFLSPQSIYQSARNLNKLYKEYYGKNPFKG